MFLQGHQTSMHSFVAASILHYSLKSVSA